MQSGGLRTKNIIKQSRENLPLITVITVVYNGEKTLERTIQSVINQTYKNIEYIIIDGASTDKTLDIIKKYEDWIDYWISELDEGIYPAMNKGIDLATGEWINFMNADDCFFDNTVIEKVFFVSKDNYAVVYGNVVFKSAIYTRLKYPKNLKKLSKGLVFSHQSSFIKTDVMKKYKYDTSFKICADKDFFYRLYKDGGHFKYINIIVAIRNIETSFSSKNPELNFKESLRISGENKYSLRNIYLLYRIKTIKILRNILPYKVVVILIKLRNSLYDLGNNIFGKK
jgi:glycosyltransferase involved in cell wall biosynthesis